MAKNLVAAAVLLASPALLWAQTDSLGPRRAVLNARNAPPLSTSENRPSVSPSRNSFGNAGENASSMSAPAFPRITNVGTGGTSLGNSSFNNSTPSNTAGRAATTPSLFGGSSSKQPSFFTADSRAGITASTRTSFQPGVLKVVKGSGTLPSDGGQVWREYDISPYTSRTKNQDKPEQAVVDWILRETGTDVWFSEPLGILSAGRNTLRVYHTPQMQELVNEIVKRMVESDMEPHVLAVRLMTVSSPAWRAKALPAMRSIDIQSPGVEAWLLSRENAAVLVGELSQRGDFRQLAKSLQVQSGQTEIVASTRPRVYPRSIRQVSYAPGIELVNGQIQEGFGMQLSPLMSLDGKTCDAAIKCNIDQVERLVPVNIDVNIGGQSQRAQIQVPQLVSWRFQERFRWPADQVLLLSCGVVASPSGNNAGSGPLGFLAPLTTTGERADALLMVECRGKASEAGLDFGLPPAAQAAMRNATPTTVVAATPSAPFGTEPSAGLPAPPPNSIFSPPATSATAPYVRRQY